MDCSRRMKTVRSAAQHHGVAAFQAKGAGVRGDVRSALVDDADDAERSRHPFDDEAVWPSETRQHPADRVGKGCDIHETPRDRFDAGLVQPKTIKKRRREALRLAVREISGVRRENVDSAFPQDPSARCQRAILLFGRSVGENARGRASACSDRAHRDAHFRFRLEHLNSGGHQDILYLHLGLSKGDRQSQHIRRRVSKSEDGSHAPHDFGRNALQNSGFVSNRSPPMRSMQ